MTRKQPDDLSRTPCAVLLASYDPSHVKASSCFKAFAMVTFSLFKTVRRSSSRGLTASKTAKRSCAMKVLALDIVGNGTKIER